MLSEIKEIFNNCKSNILDKNEWVKVTNCLVKDIEIDKYSILQYKQNFDNSSIIENVINHNESHSHSVIYINPNYKLKRIKNAIKININNIYPYCISNLWKSNLISTSDFEDKLFYIMSFIVDNKNDINDKMCNWVEMIYYIKKKSVNDILQKLVWEVYKQIFDIVKPIFVDVDVIYFTNEQWEINKEKLISKISILSNNIGISNWNIIAFDERQLEEFTN